jgi:hypothetical protein
VFRCVAPEFRYFPVYWGPPNPSILERHVESQVPLDQRICSDDGESEKGQAENEKFENIEGLVDDLRKP